MDPTTLLFADNDPDFLKTRSEFLEDEGYKVIQAMSVKEARSFIKRHSVELAIIDVRLTNDDDEKDESGLKLAREIAVDLPKIMLTNFPTHSSVREALKIGRSGNPLAVNFIDKKEGPIALLKAIRTALNSPRLNPPPVSEIKKRLKPIRLDVVAQLTNDYQDVQREANAYNQARLILAIIGAIVIIMGVLSAIWLNNILVSIISAASGVITEGIAALFDKMTKDANRRRDHYHEELLRLLKENRDAENATSTNTSKHPKKTRTK